MPGPPDSERVFCVGLNKTGTTTIKRCFTALDIVPVAPKPQRMIGVLKAILERNDYEPALRLAERYRGFEDRPWNVWQMYRRLDERFPRSRFLLTVRDPETWWRSVERWLSMTKPWMAVAYRRHLQADDLLEGSMIEAYLRYNREVIEYFRGRDDLLVLDIEKDGRWEPLCAFLGRPVPPVPFPHANRQFYDERDRGRKSKKTRFPGARVWSRLHGVARLAPRQDVPCFYCGRQATRNLKRRGGLLLPSMNGALRRVHLWETRWGAPFGARMDRRSDPKPSPRTTHTTDDMAVVCCFVNPRGEPEVLERYLRFRERMHAARITLLTVELALGGRPHELAPGKDVMRVRSPDVMWHKDRLLNLGIEESLRRGYAKVVWLDTDIAFDDAENWPQFVAAELERSALCQVFSHVVIHDGRGDVRTGGLGAVRLFQKTGRYLDRSLDWPGLRSALRHPPAYAGYGWAARAEVLQAVLPYDRAILGGGDWMQFVACFGYSDEWLQRIVKLAHFPFPRCDACMGRTAGPEYQWHYAQWAQVWARAVEQRVGCVEQTIHHLANGGPTLRDLEEPRKILLRNRYDPVKDVATNAHGCWVWASDKSRLHDEVRRCMQVPRE